MEVNQSPFVSDSSPFHGIAFTVLVQESEAGIIVVVQVEKRRFAVFVSLAHFAGPDVQATGVECVDVFRISGITVEIHSHSAGKVHCDRRAIVTAPSDGCIHLVKKLAECI